MLARIRFMGLLAVGSFLLRVPVGGAADRLTASLSVKDALAVPNQTVTIEARLVTKGVFSESGLGGEPLELVLDGEVVATSMTGGDGKARLTHVPRAQGVVPIHVRVGKSPRVAPSEGAANLLVWERRSPIVMVELAALIDETSAQGPLLGGRGAVEWKPMPDAAEELGKLTKFYYRVVYVVTTGGGGMDGFQASPRVREWLQTHQFPTGYVLVLAQGGQAMGEKIDELHTAGWTTVKIGIGRTKSFAEAFLQRRFEALIVPEPKKGEAPRKAKVAKDWKEVRKKL